MNTKMQMVQLVLETAHYRSGEELLEYEKKLQQIHKSTGFYEIKKEPIILSIIVNTSRQLNFIIRY